MYFQLRTHFKSRVGASLWLGWGTQQRVALPLMAQRRHVCVTTSSLADRHTKAESSWFPSGALLTSRMLMASILLDVGGSPSWHLRVTYCLFHLLLLTSVHIHANLVSTLFFQRWLLFLSLPVHNLLKPERFNSVLQGLQYEIHILPGQGTPADAALGYSVLPSQVKASSSAWSPSLALGGCSHSENQFCALSISSIVRSSCHIQSRGVAQLER